MLNNTTPSDSSIWNDVCLATAWFHRAQTSLRNSNSNGDDSISTVVTTAEKALSLYQSCHRRVKKCSSNVPSATNKSAITAEMSSKSATHAKQHLDNKNRLFTISLELRMAQTYRFLALVHATATTTAAATNSTTDNANENNNAAMDSDKVGENNLNSHLNLEAAIKYHDMAVSLLVGVFDEEEEDEDENDETITGDQYSNNISGNINNNSGNVHHDESNEINESREPQHQHEAQQTKDLLGITEGEKYLQQIEGEMDIWSVDSFSEHSHQVGNANGNNGDRGMLTIRVPNNDKLDQHMMCQNDGQNVQPNTKTGSLTAPMSTPAAAATTTTRATFLYPTEDQRVRAIAVSLNALAELHARCGDDRAAMDSYREALEILSAATEEEEVEVQDEDEFDEEKYGEDGDEMMYEGGNDGKGFVVDASRVSSPKESSFRSNSASANSKINNSSNSKSSTISPVTVDLANTLLNVGNFHLRRDELDAALNAYSTVWALHSGNSLDQDAANETNSHVPPSTPSSSVGVGSSCASVSLPYLTPQTPRDSLKSLGGTPSNASQSSFSTPNTNNNANANSTPSSSPGALVALNNLGIVHERRGELHEALACFEYVHRMRLQVVFGQEHTTNVDTVNSLMNIGNCHQRLQEWDKAGMAYEESVRTCRRTLLRCWKLIPSEDDTSSTDAIVKLHKSLAGALRNWGTCYWKQRRISEAIDRLNEAVDAEEKIVKLSTSENMSSGGGTTLDNIRQAKESMAQLLGLLGCLYLEYKLNDLKSFDSSEESFKMAIVLYGELGYDMVQHSSVVWARHNLMIVEQLRRAPPPPPPMMTPTLHSATAAITDGDDDNDVVDMDDIDSVELDQVLLETSDHVMKNNDKANGDDKDDDDEDDIFWGVDVNSTDELDEFFIGAAISPSKEKEAPEEVDFDAVVQSNSKQKPSVGGGANKPLSTKHRNISLLSIHDEEAQQHDSDDDERVSQLQLQTGSEEGDSLEAARAHISLAEHFWEKGDRIAATEHYTEAHSIYILQLGDSTKEVAMILKKLGDLNQEEAMEMKKTGDLDPEDGVLDAAKELYKEALEIELEVHGQYLPQTLNAAGAAALLADDFRPAMEYHRRALQIQKKSQGEEGAGGQSKYEMYETLVRIGNVYYSERNNFANISSNGVDYKEFIESGFLGWIANAHDMRGEYIQAIHFYDEGLQILGSRKGKEAKRETALTLNRLGSLTRELGRYDEAMDYHQKALNLQKSGSGVAKAMTAETCVLMGMVKLKVGDFQSALNLFEDSMLVLKSALGEDHLSVSKTMAQIGSVHFEMSNYEKAMAILLEAERCQLAFVGENNRDTLETQALIGRVLSATGKFEEALEKLRHVSERQNNLFGSKHPTIADTLSFIGECFLDQDMATEARDQFVDCHNMRKNFFTIDQIHVNESMVNVIRARKDRPGRALEIYANAMDLYKDYLPDDHIEIGRLRVYEGDAYAELLNFSTAIERYEQARQIFYKAYGGECTIDSALVAVNIGKVLLRKCDYDSAKTSFTSALNIYQQILPEGHQKITSTLNNLDRVEQEEALCV